MTDQFAGKTKAECRTMMRSADISAFFQDIEYTDHAIKAENMRGNTSKAYRSDLIVFASWLAIQCPEQTFRSVTVDDIRNYIAFLQDHRGLRPNVMNLLIWQKNVLEVDKDLFSMLSQAQKWIYAKLIVVKQEKTITGMEKESCFSIPVIVDIICCWSITNLKRQFWIAVNFSFRRSRQSSFALLAVDS